MGADVLYRLDRLTAELGLDRQRARLWALAQTVAWTIGGDRVASHVNRDVVARGRPVGIAQELATTVSSALHPEGKDLRTPSALPGRAEEMPVKERHLVLGTPLTPPFPEGTERAVFGLGCFWGAERIFWQAPGVYTYGGLRRWHHPEPDVRASVLRADKSTPRSSWSSSTPSRSPTSTC